METFHFNTDASGGYYCSGCGHWIPYNTPHICQPPPIQPPPQTNYYTYYTVDTETLNRLLEKINTLIELLKEKHEKETS